MLCLTSTKGTSSKMQNEPTKCRHRDPFKNIQPGHNIQQWRKFTREFPPTRASLIKFLGEEWKKPQHREKLEGKELYVTCEQALLQDHQEQWEEAPELKSSQEEARHTPLSPCKFMQQNLGTNLSLIMQRIQTSWSCVWACATRSHPTCSRSAGRRTGQDSWISPKTEPYTGSSVCDSLIGMHAFTGCDTVKCIRPAGEDDDTQTGEDGPKTYQGLSTNLGAHGKCLLNSLRSYRKSPATCTCHLPTQLR
ncbi:hypothetical protein GWK47_019735 [Chionoecetes opilio]|uniref:Uncharacterized protein n=1 Tax=Chionoecetes opilio TaxID=41210 RepID=A0A8J5BX35_CHIOP|nr:hypothetical protein GWK47_019735 [Chionoecetes opilio]